jgi:DNA repair photolyase
MKTYKHFATISSQVYFCSSPIRLDSYNRCQFGCTYCFSRNRSLDTSNPGLKIASAEAFEKRLARIAKGNIRSAFDEFLASRVPIQLGGLQDPFSGLELKHGVTLELLQILRSYNYPTIVSTKSALPAKEPYLSLLQSMNVLVRFSAAGVREECRKRLEIGCPSMDETLDTVSCLSTRGIPVSLRVQPVVPGHEEAALAIAERAANAGAQHISFEYLKIGTEERQQTINRVSAIVGTDIWRIMSERGITRVGRDYTLSLPAKSDFLRRAKQVCRDAGVKFGAGDTEFIHLSDGVGCCNGSAYFLKNCTQFRSNFVGVLSRRRKGDKIYFSDLERYWQPKLNVHRYLTTDSRGRSSNKRFSSWMSLLARRWNGGRSPYSPSFFFGVKWCGDYDGRGYKIYEVEDVF